MGYLLSTFSLQNTKQTFDLGFTALEDYFTMQARQIKKVGKKSDLKEKPSAHP